MNRILALASMLAIATIPPVSLGAWAVSQPDTLDSRPPSIAFIFPAGAELFHSATVETLRWTIDEQSWGQRPDAITLTELIDGSTPVAHLIAPDLDGVYTFPWTVPGLSVSGDLEGQLSLKAFDRFGFGRTTYSDWFSILDNVSAVPPAAVPDGLGQAYPNPFNPRTTVSFSLAQPAHCDLTIFDVKGRAVANLVATDRPAGTHTAVWLGRGDDGQVVSSGVYFVRLRLQGTEREADFVTRLTLVK